MHIKDLIAKKKIGEKLSKEEIEYFVKEFTNGDIPDYQMSALLMAIYFKSMDSEETANLTQAIIDSGDRIDLSMIEGIKVDKHSTGGVGDKISLIAVPLIASLGIPVAKISGRGLGHTGGTVDKLEAIPGFNVEITSDQFIENVKNHNMALVGQSGNLTPADKKIYALRDSIECVDSLPLIASSIMGKKIAAGADAIVLDVKVGSGSFMKDEQSAKELARAMVDIGKSLGVKTVAVLTNMAQPLGRQVGNANEFMEAVEVLSGRGEVDEIAVVTEICAYMAYLAGRFSDLGSARREVQQVLNSGKALPFLRNLIEIQGGSGKIVDNPRSLFENTPSQSVYSPKRGYIKEFKTDTIGRAAMLLGAGRAEKTDEIDHAAGISIMAKIGDEVSEGTEIFKMYSNRDFKGAKALLENCYEISDTRPEPVKYVLGVVD